jgi:hypothetical protein
MPVGRTCSSKLLMSQLGSAAWSPAGFQFDSAFSPTRHGPCSTEKQRNRNNASKIYTSATEYARTSACLLASTRKTLQRWKTSDDLVLCKTFCTASDALSFPETRWAIGKNGADGAWLALTGRGTRDQSCRCCSCWPAVAPLRGTGFCHGLALLRCHHMPPQQHRALLPLA